MEDRETPRIHKYGESKVTRIIMATVRLVTSGSGLGKFQAAWFFLNRRYHTKISIQNDARAGPGLQHNFAHSLCSQCRQSTGNKSLSVRHCVMPRVPSKRHRHPGNLMTVVTLLNQICWLYRKKTWLFQPLHNVQKGYIQLAPSAKTSHLQNYPVKRQ
jgi:hypothetical protein